MGRNVDLAILRRGHRDVGVDDRSLSLRQRVHPVAKVRLTRLTVDLRDVDTPSTGVVEHRVEASNASEEIRVPERRRFLRHDSKLS